MGKISVPNIEVMPWVSKDPRYPRKKVIGGGYWRKEVHKRPNKLLPQQNATKPKSIHAAFKKEPRRALSSRNVRTGTGPTREYMEPRRTPEAQQELEQHGIG